MITISSIPTVVLARDPLPIDFATNNYKLVEGEKKSGYITLLRLPVVNELFTITAGAGVYEFKCSIAISELDYNFRAPSGETINQFILNVLLPLLQSHYELNQLLRFYHNGTANRIYYEALQTGVISPFSIVDTPSDLLSQTTTFPVNADAEYRENFKINYQVIDYLTDQPISNVESLEPDANGEITVDIAEYLHQLALNSFVLNSDYPFYTLNGNIVRVYLRCWESYGIATPVIYPMSKTVPFYVLEAATSRDEQAQLNEIDQWWYNSQLTSKSFLTKLPLVRNILPGQKVLLKWLNLSNSSELKLNIDTQHLVNNFPEIIHIQNGVMNPLQYQVIQFDVSPERYNMASDVNFYTVWLTNALGETVSEIRTFTIDRNYYNTVRYFLFRNSLGGFDTIQGLGMGDVEEEYKRETAARQMPARFTTTDRETQMVSVDSQLTFKVNLGFLNLQGSGSKLWANAIRQLYNSLEVYELINNQLYPIVILTNKQKLMEDNNYLPDFFVLEYSYAFIDKGTPSNIH